MSDTGQGNGAVSDAESNASKANANGTSRMRERYDTVIRAALVERFGYTNPTQVPKLTKIVVNMGVGDAVADSKKITSAAADLALIAGQQPGINKATKSIANFKLREGMPVGCKGTLRRERMYEFLDRLVTIALPRGRDFRGVPRTSCDGRGNFALGIKEHIVFPEIDYYKTETIRGMNVAIVTTARTDEEGRELLAGFGMPFSG